MKLCQLFEKINIPNEKSVQLVKLIRSCVGELREDPRCPTYEKLYHYGSRFITPDYLHWCEKYLSKQISKFVNDNYGSLFQTKWLGVKYTPNNDISDPDEYEQDKLEWDLDEPNPYNENLKGYKLQITVNVVTQSDMTVPGLWSGWTRAMLIPSAVRQGKYSEAPYVYKGLIMVYISKSDFVLMLRTTSSEYISEKYAFLASVIEHEITHAVQAQRNIKDHRTRQRNKEIYHQRIIEIEAAAQTALTMVVNTVSLSELKMALTDKSKLINLFRDNYTYSELYIQRNTSKTSLVRYRLFIKKFYEKLAHYVEHNS